MKSLLRQKVWFPGIDRMAEESVRNCLACQVNTPGQHTSAAIRSWLAVPSTILTCRRSGEGCWKVTSHAQPSNMLAVCWDCVLCRWLSWTNTVECRRRIAGFIRPLNKDQGHSFFWYQLMVTFGNNGNFCTRMHHLATTFRTDDRQQTDNGRNTVA